MPIFSQESSAERRAEEGTRGSECSFRLRMYDEQALTASYAGQTDAEEGTRVRGVSSWVVVKAIFRESRSWRKSRRS